MMNKQYKFAAFADEAADALSAQINAMKRNGCDMLEIRSVGGKNIMNMTYGEVAAVKRELDAANISVWSLGSPLGKININDDFAPHLDKFKRALEFCDLLGCENIRMFSFYVDNKADEYEDAVMEQLSLFVDAAKGSGVTLCHENEKGIFGDIATRCEKIHKAFPEIRAVFDPANFIQCGEDTLKAYKLLSPYVHYMHIKDCTADGTVVAAGRGEGHIAEILDMYDGTVLTLEPHLWSFGALKSLEASEKSLIGDDFTTQGEAFDFAFSSLNKILEGDEE